MATVAFICCLISYLFTIALRYLFQGGKIQQIEWDMATVTAGDFAVEIDIDPTSYGTWYTSVY